MMKNLPAIQETLVRSLGQEDALEEEMATILQCSCLGKSHGQRTLVGQSPWGLKESDTTEHTCTYYVYCCCLVATYV